MKASNKSWQYSGSKWLEGLLLLIVLIIVIMLSARAEAHNVIIPDQEVSMWSGSIDNLQ